VKDKERVLFFGSSCDPDFVESKCYAQYTGNEPSPGEYVYRMMVLSILSPKGCAEELSDSDFEASEYPSDSDGC
jgi:hypothetical protein